MSVKATKHQIWTKAEEAGVSAFKYIKKVQVRCYLSLVIRSRALLSVPHFSWSSTWTGNPQPRCNVQATPFSVHIPPLSLVHYNRCPSIRQLRGLQAWVLDRRGSCPSSGLQIKQKRGIVRKDYSPSIRSLSNIWKATPVFQDRKKHRRCETGDRLKGHNPSSHCRSIMSIQNLV